MSINKNELSGTNWRCIYTYNFREINIRFPLSTDENHTIDFILAEDFTFDKTTYEVRFKLLDKHFRGVLLDEYLYGWMTDFYVETVESEEQEEYIKNSSSYQKCSALYTLSGYTPPNKFWSEQNKPNSRYDEKQIRNDIYNFGYLINFNLSVGNYLPVNPFTNENLISREEITNWLDLLDEYSFNCIILIIRYFVRNARVQNNNKDTAECYFDLDSFKFFQIIKNKEKDLNTIILILLEENYFKIN
jgi:hypothetical protein